MKFKEYFKKNKISVLFFPLAVIAVYLPIVFNNSYCADLEYVKGANGAIYNWNELGRYTLILLKKISFTPYSFILEGILFIVIAFLTVNALSFFLHLINEKADTFLLYIISATALIFPTFAEQYYFKFQSAEVLFGIFLLSLSGIFLMRFIKDKKILPFFISIVINVISFGIYQSMFNILLVMYIGIFLVLCVYSKKEDRLALKTFLTVIIQFALAFILNKIVTLIFCKEGSYFTDKIMWKTYSFSDCFHFVKHYVRIVLLAESPMYTYAFIVSVVLAFAALIFLFIKDKRKGIAAFIGYTGLLISPFAIAVIQGFEPDARTQLALPFSIAFLCFFAVSVFDEYVLCKPKDDGSADKTIKENSPLAYISLFLLILILCLDIYPTYRLVCTRMQINKSDSRNIAKIAGDLNKLNCTEGEPDAVEVIFVGTLPYNDAPLCIKYDRENKDYILIPVFSLDADTEPQFFFSTNRILAAMDNAGYNFKKPAISNNMKDAINRAADMPVYPESGYIKEYKHFVVVNLGNY